MIRSRREREKFANRRDRVQISFGAKSVSHN